MNLEDHDIEEIKKCVAPGSLVNSGEWRQLKRLGAEIDTNERDFQEVLNNIVKHANASEVKVILTGGSLFYTTASNTCDGRSWSGSFRAARRPGCTDS